MLNASNAPGSVSPHLFSKLGFIVLAHEMQNAERKVQNGDFS
jgi:hypothetical protein